MGNEHYLEGNMDGSSTVICTFWTLAQPVAQRFSPDKFAVCANQYSYDGMNTIVRAICANPHWRHFTMMGADLTHAGDIWAAFFKDGLDESGKVIGTSFTFQTEIPREALQKLRENVTMHDLRGKPLDEVVQKVNSLEKLPPFSDAQTFPEPKPPAFKTYPSEKQGFLIRAPTISHGWLQLLDLIMKFGEEKQTEYGNKQKEILNLQCVIEGDDASIPEFLPFKQKDFDEYKGKVLTAEKPENVVYTYGSRLHAWPGSTAINQVQHAINYLKKTPFTRRAVAVTWHVEKDIADKNPPCLTEIIWSVSHGKLQQTCLVRSHDMFEGWPLNLFGWRELHKKVSHETGLPLGSMIVLSTSAHIYDTKWEEAKKTLTKYYIPSTYHFRPDPRGNFVIKAIPSEKKVVLEHFTPLGEKTFFVLENTHADERHAMEELFLKLSHSNLISDMEHALYLGGEIQQAFHAMKTGKEYKQDKALN